MESLVVVGGGYAGVLAAVRAQHALGGRAQVTLVSEREAFVERIRNHQLASGQALPSVSVAKLAAQGGVRLVLGRMTGLDVARSSITLSDGTVLPYARLMLAPGSRAAVDVDGAEHAYSLEAESARQLAARLDAGAERLLVVGGGLCGLEAATELAEAHPQVAVTLVSRGPVDRCLVQGAALHLRRVLARLGVTLVEGVGVAALSAGQARLSDGRTLDFDACLWAGGFVAAPLAASVGLPTNALGQALVDDRLRSLGAPAIYVVGDAAGLTQSAGSPVEMSCRSAMPMGAHAADNAVAAMLGGAEKPFRYREAGICISLGRHDAIVQTRRQQGGPGWLWFGGRLGAAVKEWICRYTVGSIDKEASHRRRYRWLAGTPRATPRLSA